MAELIVKQLGEETVKSVGSFIYMDNEMQFWSWSPYDKCSFRCVYCSVEAQGKSRPAVSEDTVEGMFEDFVRFADNDQPLIIGAPSDAYPAEEREHELMRFVLPVIRKHNIRFLIVTHGDIVARDIDLLKDMPSLEAIGVSVPHHDDEIQKRFEPGSPPFADKVEAVMALYEAGLPVHVNVSPWIKGITEPEKIAVHFPEDMIVNVGALSYNHHQKDLTKYLFGREDCSAHRVFGKQFDSQEAINELFLEEHSRVRGGPKGNLRWLVPPGCGKNFCNHLPN